ncbi:MAG TPA: tetratricopeptide repeat protein [Gemmataceae bacterium]|nr:tetratricopeptide repeat protein [Gemmataceae bacterium]
MSDHPGRPATFVLVSGLLRRFCALLFIGLLLGAAAFGGDERSWVGRKIMTRKAGTWMGHTDWSGRQVYSAELTDMVYTVLKEQEGWLYVRQRGLEDWVAKEQVLPLENARSNFTQKIDADERDASALAHRGRAWREAGEPEKALTDLTEAVRLEPDNARWLSNRGLVYDDLQEFDRALRDYDEAIRLDPNDPLTYDRRGLAHKARKGYDLAIRDHGQAIRLDPKWSDAFFHRGNAHKARGAYGRAINDYGQAIRLDPKWPDPYFNRAAAHKARGAYDRAVSDYREAIRLDAQDADAYSNLAWLLATCADGRVRDGQKAVEYATRACELTSWKASYFLATLAAACAENGNFEEAEKWQTKALESPRYAKDEGDQALQRLQLFTERKPYHEQAEPADDPPEIDDPAENSRPSDGLFPGARSALQRLWRW